MSHRFSQCCSQIAGWDPSHFKACLGENTLLSSLPWLLTWSRWLLAGDLSYLPYGFLFRASLVAQRLNRLPAMRETWVWSLGREDPLEKEMATHSSILDWKIPWTEEPGGLQFMGLQRVRHDWASDLTYGRNGGGINGRFFMYLKQLKFEPWVHRFIVLVFLLCIYLEFSIVWNKQTKFRGLVYAEAKQIS